MCGLIVGASKGEPAEPGVPWADVFGGEKQGKKSYKILDTSVIIDGQDRRTSSETGFVDGIIVTPQFVLRELQLVADSADSLKRNRGRRGLDVLQRLQKMATLQIQIVEDDFPAVREVDLKLDRAGQGLRGQDHHQRLQPEQSRSVAGRRGAQHQRTGQFTQAHRAAGRDYEGIHPEGR